MKLEFHGKSLNYNLDGSLKGTIVTLGHMDGGHLPVVLDGDKTDLSNQELFELAMEEHYQENFPNRAENEKFNLLGEKIAEIDAATARSKEQYSNVEKMMKMTTAVGNELIASMMGGKGGTEMMINYFAMQVQLEWITLEQVPKRYLEKVRELL